MNAIARRYNKIGDGERNLSWFELRQGLTGIVSVMVLEPEYNDTDPACWELVNPEANDLLSEVVGEAIACFLESHPAAIEVLFDGSIPYLQK